MKKIQTGVRLSEGRSTLFLIFYITPLPQQVDGDEAGQLESASATQSEDLKAEETFSTEQQMTETEQETQKSSSPPPQDQEKVADFGLILCDILTNQINQNKSRGASQLDRNTGETLLRI